MEFIAQFILGSIFFGMLQECIVKKFLQKIHQYTLIGSTVLAGFAFLMLSLKTIQIDFVLSCIMVFSLIVSFVFLFFYDEKSRRIFKFWNINGVKIANVNINNTTNLCNIKITKVFLKDNNFAYEFYSDKGETLWCYAREFNADTQKKVVNYFNK